MVEGRRRVLSTRENRISSPPIRSRSVRQSVRSTSHHRTRDLSSPRSPLAYTSGASGAGNLQIANSVETLSTGEKCREFARSFVAFIFSKVGLVVLVVGYAIGGALLFQAVEGPHEDKEMHFNQVNQIRNETLNDLWQITTQLNIFSKDTWSNRIDSRIKKFQTNLIEQIRDNGYDGSLSPQWTFSGSFLFALTVITTIGYGNIAPRTDEGKITTILYAIFGIPLMLLYLTNIGGILARSFRFVYGRFCLCGNRRKALAAVNRSRSIRMQRQRSIVSSAGSPLPPGARGVGTKPPTPVLKNAPKSLINKSANVTSDASVAQTPASTSGVSTDESPGAMASSASGPSAVSPGGGGANGPGSPSTSASKGKSVTIVGETPLSTPVHRPPFIPHPPSNEQQQYHAYYQQQMSMSSQSTGDHNISDVSMISPTSNTFDAYYPYTVYGGSNDGAQSPVLPPPVSTLIAASSLGSAPAMSSTAAKAHCTRAAAITASASHAISAAASSTSQEKVHVPISLCLMILVAYVSGGGFLFSIWEEDWGYLEGSYFCFISLSTIGFGDLVPGAAVVAGEGGSQERLIICSLYLLTGLALIAMCFNLMQEEVIHKIRRIGQNLGIIKDPDVDMDMSDEDEDEEDEEDDNNANENSDNDRVQDDGRAMSNINVDQLMSSGRLNQPAGVRPAYAPYYNEGPVMGSVAAAASGGDASVANPLSLSIRRQYQMPTGHFGYPGVAYPSSPAPPPPMTPSPVSMGPGMYGGPPMMLSPVVYSPTSPLPPPPPPFAPAQGASSPLMQPPFPLYNWTPPGHS